jgi:hypothetical protein
MTDQEQEAEQTTDAIMARIAAAPTRAGKVSALIHALHWMQSIQIEPKGAQPGRATRDRWTFNVAAVGHFFNALERNDLADDFHALASSLSDLNRGVVGKPLERAPRKGGPSPRGSDVWRARAYVAAAVDALIGALPMKDIKRLIDRHLKLRFLLDEKKRAKKHALSDAAEAWREQFNGGALDNFQAMETYHHCQRLAARCVSPDELKGHADQLLRRATMRANEIERDSS